MASKITHSQKNQQPVFVGVDDGHSDVKVVLADGTTYKFPTRIAHGAHAADFPGMETDVTVYFVEQEGSEVKTPYTTHAFLQESDCIDVRFDDYAKSDMNLVMVQNALINSGLAGKDVIICTGLPVQNHYGSDGHINTQLVEAKNKNLQRTVEASGAEMAHIVKSYVATEAIAAFFDAIMDMDGKKSELYSQLTSDVVAVLDIGGKTTDFAVLYNGGRIVDRKRLGSFDMGILELKDNIRDFLKSQYSLGSIAMKHIDSALNEGKFKYGGKVYDVSEQLVEIKDAFVRKMLSTLDQKLGDLGDVDCILCVGGGAALLKENLISKYDGQAIFVESPEFSNARGMYKIAKYIAKGN